MLFTRSLGCVYLVHLHPCPQTHAEARARQERRQQAGVGGSGAAGGAAKAGQLEHWWEPKGAGRSANICSRRSTRIGIIPPSRAFRQQTEKLDKALSYFYSHWTAVYLEAGCEQDTQEEGSLNPSDQVTVC